MRSSDETTHHCGTRPVPLVLRGGIAFSSVAEGDRDFFNEAWLPTTHQNSWGDLQGQLQKLGYTYRGTSGGLVVPAYMDLRSAANIGEYREALGEKIYGIEAGSPTNDNIRQVLDQHGIEGFSVVAASGPATWQRLRSAIQDRQPIIVAGWKPHWKWSAFDLRYLKDGKTNQSPAYGPPEDIFTVVDNQFIDEFPKEAVCFLQKFEVTDQQIGSLMNTFRTRGDMSKSGAAEQWVRNHPGHVTQWLDQAEACAASDEAVTPLPDDATHSRDQEA
ncbi:glycine betaine ABC transporter substrate-binding protein [Salinibacter ruber]|uniref:glycine betaine ABC transporter substrate-binding protein n=1 Tax=Salinibacter ruber TaxID=146919 RepID=UPI0021672299|nr:glycine betaine ABC transporter substrate-binding protein [Salinibacter ruber]MCS4058613.1 glycine betaine/proline transport system substrate-binding protein [Salinibacter ruber]